MSLETAGSEILFEAEVQKILEMEDGLFGWVEHSGVKIRVLLSLVPEVRPGQKILVCGRTAISTVEDAE